MVLPSELEQQHAYEGQVWQWNRRVKWPGTRVLIPPTKSDLLASELQHPLSLEQVNTYGMLQLHVFTWENVQTTHLFVLTPTVEK